MIEKGKHIEKPLLIFILILFPPFAILLLITNYSINIPYMDQWNGMTELISAMKNGSLDFNCFWAQHNEHRIFFPKLIMVALADLSGWNVILEQYFSLFLQICTLFILLDLYRNTCRPGHGGKSSLIQLIISIILFSMVQYENWSWGWQIQFFLNIFSVCFTIWILFKFPNNFLYLSIGLIGAIVASYSLANGMIIFFVGLGLFFCLNSSNKKVLITIWLLFAVLTFCSYLFHYEKPPYHPSLLIFIEDPLKFISFFFAFIGAPFGKYLGLEASIIFGTIGLTTFIILLFFNCKYGGKTILHDNLPWLSLNAYIIGTALLIGLGRSGFGTNQALYSRYMSFSLLFWISLIMIIYLFAKNYSEYHIPEFKKPVTYLSTALCSIFICLYIISYTHGVFAFINHFKDLSTANHLILYSNNYHYHDSLNKLYPSRKDLLQYIDTLKFLKMGPFN